MLDYINENLASFWFLLGFLFLAIEVIAFGFTSGILIFGSIAALITGALFWSGLLPQLWLTGVASFVVCSILCTLLLWKPLKNMQQGAQLGQDRSSDLIGHQFTLSSDLTRGTPSSVRYSGIDWRVVLDESVEGQMISAGSRVQVVRVEVGVFHVTSVG